MERESRKKKAQKKIHIRQYPEMEIGGASVQTHSTETFKKPTQHKDISKSLHQPRSREPSISTDDESIVGDHLENIPSTIYAGELGVTIHIELQDIPQSETILPEALRTLYHTNKIKFTINFHSDHTESSIKTLRGSATWKFFI